MMCRAGLYPFTISITISIPVSRQTLSDRDSRIFALARRFTVGGTFADKADRLAIGRGLLAERLTLGPIADPFTERGLLPSAAV
jgi:hypothetical protein